MAPPLQLIRFSPHVERLPAPCSDREPAAPSTESQQRPPPARHRPRPASRAPPRLTAPLTPPPTVLSTVPPTVAGVRGLTAPLTNHPPAALSSPEFADGAARAVAPEGLSGMTVLPVPRAAARGLKRWSSRGALPCKARYLVETGPPGLSRRRGGHVQVGHVQDVTGAPLPPVAIQGRQLQPGWQGGTLLAAAGARALFAYDARVGLFLVHFRHEQRRRVAAVCALAAAAAAGSLEDVRPRPPPPPPPSY